MARTKQKPNSKIKKLDKFDNEYFWKTRKDAEQAELKLQQLQEDFNNKHIAHSGAAQMIKEKYQLKDTDIIEHSGLIKAGVKKEG